VPREELRGFETVNGEWRFVSEPKLGEARQKSTLGENAVSKRPSPVAGYRSD
jgi:hypothetical protein